MKENIVRYRSPLKDCAFDVALDLCLVRILLWSHSGFIPKKYDIDGQ